MAQSSYQLINLTTDIVVEWPSSFGTGPVVTDINDINASAGPFSITLPDATLVAVGENMLFNNVSANDFDILSNGGGTLTTVVAGQVVTLYLDDTSTSGGGWRIIPYGAGVNGIVNYQSTSSDGSITITNGTITPPGGTTDFQLPTSLFNLNNVTTKGFLIVKDTAPLIWGGIELVGGKNINITNSDGVANNPIIGVSDAVTGLTSLSVGNITTTGSTITADNTNGSIDFTTNGTGALNLNKVAIDINSNITGINNLTVNGTFNNPLTPTAYCVFTDTEVLESNDIAIQSQVNISSITGSNGSYTITFSTPFKNTNYGVLFGLGTNGGNFPFVSQAFYTLRETGTLVISIVDASGVPVNAVPNSITVMIIGPS